MPPDERTDSDITLGEVNRNVGRLENTLTAAISRLEANFASKEEVKNLRDELRELKENSKWRIGSWISTAGVVLATATAIWAIVKG